jgi:hypothetical protein
MEPPALGACSVPTLVLIVPSLRFLASVCLEATLDRMLCRVGAARHLADVTSLTAGAVDEAFPGPSPCRDLVGCRYDGETMDDHTQSLDELAKRIASAKEFL